MTQRVLLLDAGDTPVNRALRSALQDATGHLRHETVRPPDHPDQAESWHREERRRICALIGSLQAAEPEAGLAAVAVGDAGLPLLAADPASPACPALEGLDHLVLDSVPGSLGAAFFEGGLYRAFEHGAISAARAGAGSSTRRVPRHAPDLDRTLNAPREVPTLHLAGWFRPHTSDTVQRWRSLDDGPHLLTVAAWTSGADNSAVTWPTRPTRAEVITNFLREAPPERSRARAEHVETRGSVARSIIWVDQMATACEAPCTTRRWYLDQGRQLSAVAPGPVAPSSWRATPRRPVNAVGGALWSPEELLDEQEMARLDMRAIDRGPVDQRRLPERDDLLRFRSSPLEGRLDVHGDAAVELWLASDAADTALVATLVDVHPDGRQVLIRQTGLAARRRDGPGSPDRLLDRGQPARIELPLGPLSYRFGPHHQIGLHISSAAWPAQEIHPNVDTADPASSGLTLPAFQTLFHDRERPSSLILPVVPAPPTEVPRATVVDPDA